jgi:hypothetical protein
LSLFRIPLSVVAAALILGFAPRPAQAASSADQYANSVRQALALVRFAERGDQPSLSQAIAVLQSGTGQTQPEIIRDLESRPPDLLDADQRLTALVEALSDRADTADPARARKELNSILSMPRYAQLHGGPSPLDQLLSWLGGLLSSFFSGLGAGGLSLFFLEPVILAVAGLILLALVVWLVRSSWGRAGKPAVSPAEPPTSPAPDDLFTEAERRAAAGDYNAAVRSLAAAVAGSIGGERAWEKSPLTVREIFS